MIERLLLFVERVGVPAAIALYLLIRLDTTLTELRDAVIALTAVVRAVAAP